MAEAFWTAECEAELRESNKIDHHFKRVGDREELMDNIDKERANTTYSHFECSEECKKRGKNPRKLYKMLVSVNHMVRD